MKQTELFIFIDLLLASIFGAFVGTVPLVGPTLVFSLLLASVFAVLRMALDDRGLNSSLCVRLIEYAENLRPRKLTIQFLDPLQI